MAKTATRSKSGTTRRTGRAKPSGRKATQRTSSRAGASRPKSARKTAARSTRRKARSTTARRKTASRARTTARRPGATRSRPRSRQKDIIAVLMKDHREVEQMFSRYERLGDRATKSKKSIVRDVIEELSKHAAVEEQVLYPEMKRNGGESLADEGIEEHGEVKRLLANLDKMDPADDGFDDAMTMLMQNVRHHVKEEEGEMFPKLRSAVEKDRLVELGEVAEGAKMIAPTRPHPRAPSTPPANVVVGAVAGVADRVRDAGRKLLDR